MVGTSKRLVITCAVKHMDSSRHRASSDGRASVKNPFSSPPNAVPNPFSLSSTVRVTAMASDASFHNPFELFPGDQKCNGIPTTKHSLKSSVCHSWAPSRTTGSLEAMTKKLRTALRVSLQAFARQNASIKLLRESERNSSDCLDRLYDLLAVAGSRNRVLEGEVHMLRQLNIRTIDEVPEKVVEDGTCGAFPDTPSEIEHSRRESRDLRIRCQDSAFQLRALTKALAESENENEVLKGQLSRQREVIGSILGAMSQEGRVEMPPKQRLEDSINQLHNRLTRTLGNETAVPTTSLDDPNWKWETGMDKSSGRVFWINHVDQTTQWEPPPNWENLPLPPPT